MFGKQSWWHFSAGFIEKSTVSTHIKPPLWKTKVSAHAGAWRNEFRGDHACTLRVHLGTTLDPLGRVDSSIYIDVSMEVFSRSNILTRHNWSVPNHYAAVPRSWVWWVASEAQWGDREVVVDSQVWWFRNPTSISWTSLYIENLPIFLNRCRISIMTYKYRPVLNRITIASECARLGGYFQWWPSTIAMCFRIFL